MRLQGKVALITGGGTGIGAAVAEAFIREGARVCIAGRRREVLEKFARRFSDRQITVCPADVSKLEDVQAHGGNRGCLRRQAGRRQSIMPRWASREPSSTRM